MSFWEKLFRTGQSSPKVRRRLASFHEASGKGDLETVKALFKRDHRLVLNGDDNGNTALHFAADKGRIEIAKFLLASGADVNATEKKGNTPLHRAAENGDRDFAELLLANGADVNATNNYSDTPLGLAAYRGDVAYGGHKDVAELLLGHGADVNAKPGRGNESLHRAVRKGYRDLAELLLAHGADVNAKGQDGRAPLHEARGATMTELLLSHGAKVDAMDDEGQTPLYASAFRIGGDEDQAEVLLAHGADVNAKGQDGRAPLHEARGATMTELLLSHGAKVDAMDDEGQTPLYAWAFRIGGDEDQAEVLLAHGAQANATAKDGSTPLHAAAGADYPLLAKMLLANQADVNAKALDGSTPLHWAAHIAIKSGCTEVVEVLLAHGANLFAENAKGETPLQYAAAIDNWRQTLARAGTPLDFGLLGPIKSMSPASANRYDAMLVDMDARWKAEKLSKARGYAANFDKFRQLLDRQQSGEAAVAAAEATVQSVRQCPICGTPMKPEPLSFGCSEGHEKISWSSFNNNYATLSASVASLLKAKGYQVEKPDDSEIYSISGRVPLG